VDSSQTGTGSHIVTQVRLIFLFIHVTLVITQPRQSRHHIEELSLPRIEHHDIIVTSNDAGVEVVFQGVIPDDLYTIHDINATGVISGQFNNCPPSRRYGP